MHTTNPMEEKMEAKSQTRDGFQKVLLEDAKVTEAFLKTHLQLGADIYIDWDTLGCLNASAKGKKKKKDYPK